MRFGSSFAKHAMSLAMAVSAFAAAAQPAKPPLEAFFAASTTGEAVLSPSGRYLAVTIPGGPMKRMRLAVIDLDAPKMEAKVLAGFKDAEVSNVTWINDKRLSYGSGISQKERRNYYGSGLWAIDVDGQQEMKLIRPYAWVTDGAPRTRELTAEWGISDMLRDGSDDIIVERSRVDGRGDYDDSELARLNTRTGQLTKLMDGVPTKVRQWALESGVPKVVATAPERGLRRVYLREGSEWRSIAEFKVTDLNAWSPRRWLDGHLYVAQPSGADRVSVLKRWDPKTGQPEDKPVLSAPGFDSGGASPVWDYAKKKLLGWRHYTDAAGVSWIDPTMQAGQEKIDSLLPGRSNSINCTTCIDGKRWLVTSASDRVPLEWHLYEPATQKLTLLLRSRSSLDVRALGTTDFVRIKARDGIDLPVYVTLPNATHKKPAPAVLLVHGGPQVRDGWEFDAEVQFLASRGYVVLQTQFRGGTGFGSKHTSAGFKQWGLSMQDDLEDGLQWAINKGYVDASKVCIMGASYGGYAALMGPVRHPKRFQCAVSYVGVTDLPLLYDDKNSDSQQEWTQFGFGMMLGDVVADAQRLRETSPVNRVNEIKIPVLGVWGAGDVRVPIEHGRKFRDAAVKAGVRLDYHEYLEEGHGWWYEETRFDFYRRVEKFLAQHLDAGK